MENDLPINHEFFKNVLSVACEKKQSLLRLMQLREHSLFRG